MNVLDLPVKKLHPDAKLPTKAHPSDAGWDLYAYGFQRTLSTQHVTVSTGVAFEIPSGYCGIIYGRSGRAFKDLVFCGHHGIIDSSYRGEVKVLLDIGSGIHQGIKKGDRIAQILFFPVPNFILVEVPELRQTDRGEGGFGSTGI